MLARIPRILLVDDNEGDIDLTQEAFRECGVQAHFYICTEGDEALRFLLKEGPFADTPVPDLIILDLNLPRLDGRVILQRIKSTPQLRRIPTIILTSSARAQDVDECYGLRANTYIVKPALWSDFLLVVRAIEQYWFTTATLPA